MYARPQLRPHLDAFVVEDRVLVLREERHESLHPSPVLARLVPLLDGTRTLSDLMGALGPTVAPAQIFFALEQLDRQGFTVEAVDGDGPLLRSARALRLRSPAPRAQGSVRVRALGDAPSIPLGVLLEADGVEVIDASAARTSSALEVVVVRDYLDPELASVDAERAALGQPWMLVKPVGLELWVGPIIQRGRTGCWRCLSQRLSMNRQAEAFVLRHRGQAEPLVVSCAEHPATLDLAAALTAVEVARYLLDPEASPLVGVLRSIDVLSRKVDQHHLARRPQCPVCGTPRPREASPARPLVSRPKRFRQDGGHRILTPEETYERHRRHVSRILGVVTELVPTFDGRIPLMPSYLAGHNFAMGSHAVALLRESLRGSSGGKGTTDVQARVSGLCEAIERYSGNYQGDEPAVRGSLSTLGPAALHPNAIMGFAESQYERRRTPHPVAPQSRCVLVPHPFDPTMELDWTPAWSLTRREVRYLPAALCWYGHPDFERAMSMFPESNGTASGNCLEEAILQGFLELVERDAAALWWYNRVRRPAVDLDSFGVPYLSRLRDFYPTIGRELWAIDITGDLPVPVYACLSRRIDREPEDIILGFGAHLDPKIALSRAATEVNQFLPSLLLENRDGSTRYLFGDPLAVHWWKTATVAEQDYLVGDPRLAVVRGPDVEDRSRDDLLDDIQTCLDMCIERGMEVIVLDQTRPDIGLDVVKVVVPELCHFWRRLGKPRLFDVPAARGWVEERVTPETCNPYTVFF